MLGVVGLIDDDVEAAKLVSGQHVRQLAALLGWPKLALLTNSLGDISPVLIVETGFANDPSDLGDEFRFRLSVL